MVQFDYWIESLIFWIFYAIIIIVPCVIIALMGRKMIAQLGLYPSRTPSIQMSVCYKLIIVEVITFTLLIAFYHFFEGR